MSDAKLPPAGLEQGPSEPDTPIPLVPGQAGNPARRRRPLPDAQAIAQVDIPDLAPPYDDVVPRDIRPRRSRRLRLVGLDTGAGPTAEPAALAPARTEVLSQERLPGAGTWPSQFAQILAETLAGARPAKQLAPWTTQQARRRISELGPMLAGGSQPRVRRIIASSPVPGVLEMTAIVAVGGGVRAVAIRLERPLVPTPAAGRSTGPARPPDAASPADRAAPRALTAAPASLRAAQLRANATWLCTAVEVA
ncbi:MAG TPA: Rv3235 family protein [Streptosporangiaceae bacterium]